MIRGLFLISLLITSAITTFSQKTFDGGLGGTGTDWDTPVNWSDDEKPIATDNVIIPSPFSVIISTGPEALCNNLTINTGGSLTVDGELTYHGDILNSGILTINGTMSPPGATQTSVCGAPFVDQRDGKSYNTVEINSKCWMAENLNVGIAISWSNTVPQNSTDNDGIIEKWCADGSTANAGICEDGWGGYYQWESVMQNESQNPGQGICPDGWLVPSSQDFIDLYNEFLPDDGPAMKDPFANGHWWSQTVPNSANAINILGGGFNNGDALVQQTFIGEHWTSETFDAAQSKIFRLSNAGVPDIWQQYITSAVSVRCIRSGD